MTTIFKILLFSSVFAYIYTLDCRDQENHIVDWYIVYKIPTIKTGGELIKDGVGYMYMTSKYNYWNISNISINSTDSIIGNTLAGLYEKNNDLSYVLYNDENPNGKTSSSKGHTKGVVAGDKNGGFWLVHSVPKFPELKENYAYPKSGATYGQTFLCVSMNLENLNKVGIQLQYNQPNVYDQNIQKSMETSIPDLAHAAANITIKTAPWSHISALRSKKNVQFLSFAKSKKFNNELYEDLVAPYLGCDLKVETWPNGSGRLTSNCTQEFRVNNIKSIDMDIANVNFTTTKDHSKWAVSSTTSGKFLTCIGDINRAEHQKVRGGGTVCIDDKDIANSFQNLIGSFEDC